MTEPFEVLAAEFDATLDDWTDVSLRMSQATETYRRNRWLAQWSIGLIAAGASVVAFNNRSTLTPLVTAGISLALAFALGIPVAFAYGRYYDGFMRRYTRRTLFEMFHGAASVRCRFELRADGLWSRSEHVEIIMPWSKVTRIDDVPGSIEFWFDPGFAVVRDRGFRTPAERAAFLARARELSGAAEAAPGAQG